MGLIEYYLIFAITTSIFAIIDVFIPELNNARQEGVRNVLTENPKLSVTVYFVLTVLIAPFVILPLLVPSMNVRFRNSLGKVIHEQEKI
jgi:uncharacterized membrane protein YdjX (TVP38/TMEM64 family)